MEADLWDRCVIHDGVMGEWSSIGNRRSDRSRHSGRDNRHLARTGETRRTKPLREEKHDQQGR